MAPHLCRWRFRINIVRLVQLLLNSGALVDSGDRKLVQEMFSKPVWMDVGLPSCIELAVQDAPSQTLPDN